jgi:uncharacterized protein YbjT (DUF2867 family)
VKFGINYNTGVVGVDPDALIAFARHAEACGFDLTPEDVAEHAARGVDRLVVGPASAELSGQFDQLSAFADRLALR